VRRTRVTYFGFELDRESEYLDEFPQGDEEAARRALAVALAGEEARHPAVRRNRDPILQVREWYRRSGGSTPRLGMPELAALYERALGGVASMTAYRTMPLRLDLDSLVPSDVRERLDALPSHAVVRGGDLLIDYDVEERDGVVEGVARLVVPEKMARSLVDEELPVLDRPLRFVVHRGSRGSVRASTLTELQDLLDRPWAPDEQLSRRKERDEEHRRTRRDRASSQSRSELDRARRGRDGRRVNPKRRRGR
jgi:hypothetical protein